eukprot:gene5764-6061_t
MAPNMDISESWFSSEFMGRTEASGQVRPSADFPRNSKAPKAPKYFGESRSVFGDIDVNQAGRPGPAALSSCKPGNDGSLMATANIPSGMPQNTLRNFLDPSFIDGPKVDVRRKDWVDADLMNRDDPQSCSDYSWKIFMHMREAEMTRRANPMYLETFQADVNSKMRAILVDWLVEVAEEYKLCADTLYQTINYLDRFLSVCKINRNKLQLVAAACMWVASKYEEIYPPSAADFVYITDNTYTRDQVLQMEEAVLKILDYELTVPTAKLFLRRLLQVCNPDELLHYLSNYLTEVSLLDHNMLQFLPSEIAAASVYLSNLILQRQPWDGTLQHFSMYSSKEIRKCVKALAALHQALSQNTQLTAIYN